ncbi:COX15/CtaA family protein [Candidatus Pelagibacter sp.]|nr:COX15/CtaA family protein [Candidatus Pelagibacter sp.]
MYTLNTKINNQLSLWLITMFWFISIIIIIGGLTRLTDSGLSITEWELFTGFIPPLNQNEILDYFNLYKLTPEYKLQNFSMTIDEFKIIFWWEWAHRFFARIIGLCFLIPLIYFTIIIGFERVKNLYLIFFLICFQGFIGWFMVTSGLTDRVDVSHFRLSIHLIIAFIILSLVFWNYLKLKYYNNDKRILSNKIPEFFLFLIFLQIIIGAFVSGMDAGKIYNSWPLMGDSYFPNDNKFSNLFELSVFNDPSLVQFIHRNLAYFILITYLVLLYLVKKKKINVLYKPIYFLGFIILLQVILGIFTVLNNANIVIASFHQISSILLVSSSIYLLFRNRFN